MDTEAVRKQFNIIAKKYDEGRRCLLPCFDDFYNSVQLLKELMPDAHKIVDLGAGTGLLSKELYRLYPDANFLLIDLSEEMIGVARERFKGLDNFSFIVEDYIAGIPDNCDIIASALSIHHLEDNDKYRLYKNIYDKLGKGKCFINLDQFCSDSKLIESAYDKWWLNYIDKSGITEDGKTKWMLRKKLDREISVNRTMAMLKDIGFEFVECIYSFMKFSTVIAIK